MFNLSLCFLFSVSMGAFVIGLSQISSSFLSDGKEVKFFQGIWNRVGRRLHTLKNPS